MSKLIIDTLYVNANFYTSSSEQEKFLIMGVRKGKICFLSNEMPNLQVKIKRTVNLKGLNAYPALTDSHLHLLYSIVQSASDALVCEIKNGEIVPNSMLGIEKRIREIASNAKKGAIIAANNYILSAIDERRLPTRFELDEWTGSKDVVVFNIDGHSSAVSSSILKKLGIDSENHNGVLTGWQHESIQGKITELIASSVNLSVLARGVANFENQCASFGISRVCAMDGAAGTEKDTLTSLLVFLARRMKIAVRFYPEYIDTDKAKRFLRFMKRPRVGGCGEWEMDGSVGSHSAAMSIPFKDTDKCAPCYYEQDFIKKTVQKANADGFQIASHAIGDRAILLIQNELTALNTDTMHRIEHYEFPNRQSVDALKKANIAITVQPGYAWIDRHYLHSYEQHLTTEAIKMQLPLKELHEAGVMVCGSSDSPVQTIDPFVQMLGMTDFAFEEQSLSPYQAFLTYSQNPAVMLDEQKESGSLKLGAAADFFISESDIFSIDKLEIGSVKVNKMFIGGKEYIKKNGSVIELLKMLLETPRLI